jgi:predicted Zn-dependent peptidase
MNNPDHAAISIVGDFNSKMKAALTVLFSKWKKSVTEEENPLQKLDCHPQESRYYNKEDARKLLFYQGVSRNNPDYVAIEVVAPSLADDLRLC